MVLFLLLLGVLSAFYVYMRWCFSYWNRRNVPSPDPSFFVGNIGPTLVFKKHMGTILDDWYKKFNDVPYFGYYKLMRPGIVVRDAELVKSVMIRDFASFQDNGHKVSKKSDPLFGQNPFFLSGDEWQAERKNITPLISPAKMKALLPKMQITCERLVDYLKTLSPTEDVEAADLAILYTIENVVKCAFSLDANCFQRNERSIFMKARDVIFKTHSYSFIKFLLLPVLPQWFIEYLSLPIVDKESAEFFRKLVIDNKKSRTSVQPMGDIFETMLKMQDPKDKNDESLVARSTTIYFEGSETSSIALSFALYELAKNPEVQERLFAEVNETLANNKGALTLDVLNEMKYLENVFLEALRLHSPVLYMAKTCTRDYELPRIRGQPPVTIHPDTDVLIPVRSFHLDPEHFTEPEAFIPDRFDSPDVRNSPVYLPFGSGPRVCIGMRFASTQVRLALFHVIKNFRLSVSPNHKPPVVSPLGAMLQYKDGILINFDQRVDYEK